ncbi:MAG: uroporphyrinogen-III C-methyltransferase [Flavobacterium sp.]|nr:uroporphyrinogen-III C-methyltransferase [Flavobacterium sp.]
MQASNNISTKGYVIIAGAGPGDADLITIKLQKQLAIADVIISDRLVNTDIITNHARKNVEVIIAGKQAYNNASYTQDEINALIVAHAAKGKRVLRLKGGDVAFFSNVLNELYALLDNNIPFEIIPGITAAAGASAYTGIPLTARGFAQGVQWITFNPSTNYRPEKWAYLAATEDTLVFYMASKNVGYLAALLTRYAPKKNTPIAVIEQATTPHQKVSISTLQKCAADFKDIQFSSPSLVIVGEVVSLHHQFKWFKTTATNGSIFKELTAK